jgi:hypothetical protein
MDMTSDAEMTNSDWAIEAFEAAARAMYVHRSWKKALAESKGLRKDKSHYEAIAGGNWDAGLVNRSQYIELRELAAAAVLASLPNVIAVTNAGTNTVRADAVWEKIIASGSPWSGVRHRARRYLMGSR